MPLVRARSGSYGRVLTLLGRDPDILRNCPPRWCFDRNFGWGCFSGLSGVMPTAIVRLAVNVEGAADRCEAEVHPDLCFFANVPSPRLTSFQPSRFSRQCLKSFARVSASSHAYHPILERPALASKSRTSLTSCSTKISEGVMEFRRTLLSQQNRQRLPGARCSSRATQGVGAWSP